MNTVELLENLVDQIDRCHPVDDHGHDFRMNNAFIEAKVAVRLARQRKDEEMEAAYEAADPDGWKYSRLRP